MKNNDALRLTKTSTNQQGKGHLPDDRDRQSLDGHDPARDNRRTSRHFPQHIHAPDQSPNDGRSVDTTPLWTRAEQLVSVMSAEMGVKHGNI